MNRILRAIVCAAALCASHSWAETWPARPITIIAPGPAGGTSDIYARIAADGLSKGLGNPVIVENKAGVGTLLGARAAAQAKPAGYPLLVGPASLTLSPYIST